MSIFHNFPWPEILFQSFYVFPIRHLGKSTIIHIGNYGDGPDPNVPCLNNTKMSQIISEEYNAKMNYITNNIHRSHKQKNSCLTVICINRMGWMNVPILSLGFV